MTNVAAIGTPLLDPYGKSGFIADIKAVPARTFTLSGGMRPASVEYVCCFESRVSDLIDGIAEPFIERARRANLPAVPADQIPARLAAARQAQDDQRRASELARLEEGNARQAFEADAAKRVPAWAKAVIVAELVKDDSDSMTDYFNSKTLRRVILAFSKHTRDLFPELRQAARNFKETESLADAPESAEHREKYSMGGGYYLKNGYRHKDGWRISKVKFYNDAPARYIPTGEWSLAPVAAPIVKESAPAAPSAAISGIRIETHRHTTKGFEMHICVLPGRVERAEFDRLNGAAKDLGGWYSRPWNGTPGGFAFKDRAKAETFAKGSPDAAPIESSAPAAPARGNVDLADKMRGLADGMQRDIDSKLADRLANTPKRQREAASARIDGRHLQRTQAALRALAALHDAGNVPPILAKLKTKADIHALTGARIDRSHSGYYDAGVELNEPATDSDLARALWELVAEAGKADIAAETLRRKVEALQFSSIPGYFPTPLPVIESMIFHADMPAGECDVLEPEGGSGAILDVLRSRFKSARLTTYERHFSLQEVLRLKGYSIAGNDFLASRQCASVDRVLMNPPFEDGQDMAHVRHAFECLRPGGRLVAIMSTGPFFRMDRKATDFRAWFEERGGEKHDLPAGSFKASGTGVATVLIVITREA